MKKKYFTIGLVIVICTFLTACSDKGKKPDTVSEEMYVIGKKVVKVIDKYLDADLTFDEAYAEIKNLDDQASSLEKNDQYNGDLGVKISISTIQTDMFSMSLPFGAKGTDADLKKDRDDLSEELNLE